MTRRNTAYLIAVLCLTILQTALACRYNVRETGFVDLGIEPYRLVLLVDSNTDQADIGTFKKISAEMLAESNIMPALINVDEQPEHAVIKHATRLKIDKYPAAILISPDEPLLPPEKASTTVKITQPDKPFAESLTAAIKGLLNSPIRKNLIEQICRNYAAVLLLMGPDPEQNRAALEGAEAAVKVIEEQMDFLPKPIAHPPVTVVVDHNDLISEQLLLWSMALTPDDVNMPHAAVIYGRARWIGPMFRGPEIIERNLAEILAVVGNDCECGLDYRWLQGTMLPAEWKEPTRKIVAENLGFDPENPMIQMEMARILGRGGAFYGSSPYGYQELEIDIEPTEQPQTTTEPEMVEEPDEPAETEPAEAPAPDKRTLPAPIDPNRVVIADANAAGNDMTGQEGILKVGMLPLGIASLIVLIIGAAIAIRTSTK